MRLTARKFSSGRTPPNWLEKRRASSQHTINACLQDLTLYLVCLCKVWWVLPHLDSHATETNQLGTIPPECVDGCLACWCQTDNFRGIFVPGEVIFPLLLVRVKQGNGLTCMRSDGNLSRAL
jgi:hypothetical protein